MLKTGMTSIFICIAVLFISHAWAQELLEPQKPLQHSPIMPVKIKPVQEGADGVSKAAPDIEQEDDKTLNADNLALYATQSEGSLGEGLWHSMTRAEVVNAFSVLPVPAFSPAQRELTLRLLLSKSSIEAAKNPSEAYDILSLRLTRLVEMGAYKEAISLYEKLDGAPATSTIATSGMKAFVGNGQLAIACLEEKALDASFKSSDMFWADLDTFCKEYIKTDSSQEDPASNLSRTATAYSKIKKLQAPARFEDLNSTSLIELMALAKSGVLDNGKWSIAAASTLTPATISFLLAMQPTRSDVKLSLMAVAVAHGIVSVKDLEQAYNAALASPFTGEWKQFLADFAAISTASNRDAQVRSIKSMLSYSGNYSPEAYLPTLQYLQDLPLTSFSQDEARQLLKIYISGKEQIPITLVNFSYGTSFAAESGDLALLKVWSDENANAKEKMESSVRKDQEDKKVKTPQEAYSIILQDFIANPSSPQMHTKLPYDNFLILTGSSNYVMPLSDIREKLKKATQAKSIGRVIAYGLQILGGNPTDKVHPVALAQVLKAFQTAGLSEETKSLAHEALAGLTSKKKEN